MLVTLRTRFRSLRCQFVYPTVRGAIADSNRAPPMRRRPREHQCSAQQSGYHDAIGTLAESAKRTCDSVSDTSQEGNSFRVCEYSVQEDHIHLLVEATSKSALERGIRALSIRLAKRVNQLVFRRGKFIADRYHSFALKTPRAVRNALVYVLANHRKHGHARSWKVDPYSSGPYFLGFAEFPGVAASTVSAHFVPRALAPPAEAPVARAGTWLLAHGWLRHGRVSIFEQPKGTGR